MKNPHTARQDADTWKRLYELQRQEAAKLQIIIEVLASQLAATKEITP